MKTTKRKPKPSPNRPVSFSTTLHIPATCNYLLFQPTSTAAQNPAGQFPLMLFLHGAGERGSNVQAVKTHGPPKVVEAQPDFPFLLVSPQCPLNEGWNPHLLRALLDDLMAHHPIDPARIYLTGLSMGGYGTWALARLCPDRFAALVPVCGGAPVEYMPTVKHIPTWIFHGLKDTTVHPDQSKKLAAALRKLGAKPKLTLYPEAGHDSWTVTYDNPALYVWLLKQRLPAKAKSRKAK